MPRKEKEHVKGVGDEEQRMYEHIKEEAARTVKKHHEREHHKKGE